MARIAVLAAARTGRSSGHGVSGTRRCQVRRQGGRAPGLQVLVGHAQDLLRDAQQQEVRQLDTGQFSLAKPIAAG
jgi:hypothetical protein